MNKYHYLLVHDLRHAVRDPVLMVGIFAPLALLAVSRLGFPAVAEWLSSHYSFDLYAYSSFTGITLAITIPMLIGTMTGLLMLDERDEQMISYYAVTPLMRKGYMQYRLVLPLLLAVPLSGIYLLFSGRFELQLGILAVLLLLALEAPCFTLFLAALAGNKVEGLALSKISGLLLAGTVVVYFAPGTWKLLGIWLPSYWTAQVFFDIETAGIATGSVHFSIGLAYHLILLYVLVKVFEKRAD
jgi:fluoroquinolone transport system permease protein